MLECVAAKCVPVAEIMFSFHQLASTVVLFDMLKQHRDFYIHIYVLIIGSNQIVIDLQQYLKNKK